MKGSTVICLMAIALQASPLFAQSQSDRVKFPSERGSDPVMFPADANANAGAEPRSDEVKPPERRRPTQETPPAEEPREQAAMAEFSLANRSTNTIWVEANPAEHVLALSIQERPGGVALLPGDFQRNGLPAGGYSILVEGLAKGSPMPIEPGRAYALEFSGSLGAAPGVFARMTEDGRPMFETVLRPVPPAAAQVVTTQTTQLVTERRICRHCGRWVSTQRYVTVPTTRVVAGPSTPIVADHPNHAFEHRWICGECDRVFAGPGECPECDEGLEWKLVAFRCPTHHDVVVSTPDATCWRCGGATAELIVAGQED